MSDHATQEEMLAAFGPFAVVFEPIGDDRTPYLSLLLLHDARVKSLVADIELQALIGKDMDDAGSVAASWREHFLAIATQS